MINTIVVALLIATAAPLVVLYLVLALDLYATGSPRAIALAFSWGAASVFIALCAYRLIRQGVGDLGEAPLFLYIAPILEETLKALVLLYLIRRPTFTYFVDGAVYGFAVGIGFAVFENYLYIFQNIGIESGAALGRVLSTNLMHAGAGAIVGISLGVSRFRRFHRRVFYVIAGLLLAILLHAAFNRLVLESGARPLFLYAVAVGLCSVAFTAFAIRRGLATERAWIAETLGMANGITSSEVSAARRLDQVPALLAPLKALFGDQKAAQIEELLLLQAQLGILRKTRERSQDQPQTTQALSREIDRKQEEMETIRRSIGAYTMASFRLLFPAEGNAIWRQLDQELRARHDRQERSQENVFTLVEKRQQERRQRSEPGE